MGWHHRAMPEDEWTHPASSQAISQQGIICQKKIKKDPQKKKNNKKSSYRGSAEMDLTSIHEDASLILGLAVMG